LLLTISSATQVLWEMVQDYQKQNIFVCFVKLRPHLKKTFLKSDIIGALGGNRVFTTLTAALSYVEGTVLQIQKSNTVIYDNKGQENLL
jgi:hypothetical protein